ncbi:unnamed protein product, partial [Prorocentrum cordatum]
VVVVVVVVAVGGFAGRGAAEWPVQTPPRSLSQTARANLRNEVGIHLALDHPQITRLLDVYEVEQELILVMECMEGGELFDRVIEREVFSEKDGRRRDRGAHASAAELPPQPRALPTAT